MTGVITNLNKELNCGLQIFNFYMTQDISLLTLVAAFFLNIFLLFISKLIFYLTWCIILMDVLFHSSAIFHIFCGVEKYLEKIYKKR